LTPVEAIDGFDLQEDGQRQHRADASYARLCGAVQESSGKRAGVASQYQGWTHAQATQRPSRKGAMAWWNGSGAAGMFRPKRTWPTCSRPGRPFLDSRKRPGPGPARRLILALGVNYPCEEQTMFNTVLGFWDFWWIMMIVMVLVSSVSVYLKPRVRARLARLEAKVDLVLRHAGLTYDPKAHAPPGVFEALQRGDKIGAIKCYRKATGAGLADAKAFVEELQVNPQA
jgi:hypothetical protein